MMNRLWIKRITCDIDTASELVSEFESFRPQWYLHGVTPFVYDDTTDNIVIILWAEGSCDEVLRRFRLCESDSVTTELLGDEYHAVISDAALAALKIAVHPNTCVDMGESLLRRNPECRKADTPEEAIILAALAERKKNFTEEDYEE